MPWINRNDGTFAYTSAEGENNARMVRDVLASLGWSLNAICGVLGNIFAEGGGNPWQWEYSISPRPPAQSYAETTGYGYGLFGWTPAKKYIDAGRSYSGYGVNYAGVAGSPDDGTAQTALMSHCIEHPISYNYRGQTYTSTQWITGARGNAHSTTTFGKNWYNYYVKVGRHTMQAADFKVSQLPADYLALTFLECFEGPFNPLGSYATRQRIAAHFWELFSGEEPTPPPTPTPTPGDRSTRFLKLCFALRAKWKKERM